jgi:16S rRNA processing protein RimM
VSVEPVTDFPKERFAVGASMQCASPDGPREIRVESSRPHGARLLVRFGSVTSLEQARRLSGCELTIAREERIEAPEDFFFSDDLEGWPCRLPTGEIAGEARRLERGDAGSHLVVFRGGREHLVPFTRPIVTRIDRRGREIWIEPPEGLWELESEDETEDETEV